MNPHNRRLLALCAAACLAPLACTALAQEAKTSFQVPPGAASVAVHELARQAGVTVLANGDDLAGKRTGEVSGRHTLRQALDLLLAGSGLAARLNSNGTVLIEAAPVAAAQSRPAPARRPPAALPRCWSPARGLPNRRRSN